MGDWEPDRRKYPNGLGPLARHVVARGMEFGLWVSTRNGQPRQRPPSRAHPDWALQAEGGPAMPSRHQLVLDMDGWAGARSPVRRDRPGRCASCRSPISTGITTATSPPPPACVRAARAITRRSRAPMR
ncbi:alpha-galactosidase [Sphingomonas sp. MMS24-JH45]